MNEQEKKAYLAKKKREWREANREKFLATRKKYYAANKEKILAYQKSRPGYLEDAREYRRKYVAANPELVKEQKRRDYIKSRDKKLAYNREYYAANSERLRKAQREWQINNMDKVLLSYAKRRAMLKSLPHERINYEDLVAKSKGLCGVCKEKLDGAIHIDHIIPISRGGHHTLENTQLAHSECNLWKADKILQPKRLPKESN